MAEIKHEPVSTQPRSTVPMSVGNKNAMNRPDGTRDWSHSLFACFTACGTCCFACWCPCIVYSKNIQRLHSLQYQHTPLLATSEQTCDCNCMLYCCLSCLGLYWVLQMQPRGEIRRRYAIRGSTCGDCCASCWCSPCALTQERRELQLEENSFPPQVQVA